MRRRSAASASRARVCAFSFTSKSSCAASHSWRETIGGVFISAFPPSGSRDAPLIDQRAAADVDNRRRHAAGPVGGGEGGRVADVLERCGPPEQRLPLDQLDNLLATLEALWERLGHPSARERDDAYSVRAQLDGELPPDRLDRVEGDLRPAQVVVAQ